MEGQSVAQHGLFQKPEPLQLSLREQIKLILAMTGDAFSSVKKLKAIYAILQSISPRIFCLDWDTLFFSVHSRNFWNELQSMILETGEVKEALWGREVDPFHHIYFLARRARKSLTTLPERLQQEQFYIDLLFWALLPAKFSIYWSYLLELRSTIQLPEETREIPFLPMNRQMERGKYHELCSRIENLDITLSMFKIGPLRLSSLSRETDNNLYLFLPFEFGDDQWKRFINFYQSPRHNKYVVIERREEPYGLNVRVRKEGIRIMYDYVRLREKELKIAMEQFDLNDSDFDSLVRYFSPLYDRCKTLESCATDRSSIESMENKRERFYRSLPSEIKTRIIQKGRILLCILQEYYDIADFRFNDIMETLEDLASLTKDYPIKLTCESFKVGGFLNNIPVRNQTLVSIEFSKEFLANYSRVFNHELPAGELQHVQHFVQPMEVFKAIHNAIHDNGEQALLWGGPVLGEY